MVTDDGKTYRGRDEIRDWLSTAAIEYTYTTELVSTRQLDANTYVAVNHLEGNFPGGTVDLDDRLLPELVPVHLHPRERPDHAPRHRPLRWTVSVA